VERLRYFCTSCGRFIYDSRQRSGYADVLQRTSTRGVVLLPSRAKTLPSPCGPCQCARVLYTSRADAKIASHEYYSRCRIIYDERGVAEQVAHRNGLQCLNSYYSLTTDPGAQALKLKARRTFRRQRISSCSTRLRPASHVFSIGLRMLEPRAWRALWVRSILGWLNKC
jgi:hypothetical protein